jgi:beta-glucanase (GH16 family)
LRLFSILVFCFPAVPTAAQICDGKKVVLANDGICNEKPYLLVFADEFSDNYLDTTKWKPARGVVRDLEHKIAQQWYSKNNIEVSNGVLKLIVKREKLANQCYNTYNNNSVQTVCEDFNFSAGQISTIQKFKHGIIEMSCKLPKGKGIGSSFWMFGDPAKNEIDIFEFENENNATGKFNEKKLSRVHLMNSRTDFNEDGEMEDCPSHYSGP